MKPTFGFTLIELLLTLVIMTTLAALALPSYQEYVRRANRADGYTLLTEIMQAQERFFADQVTYTVDLTDLGYASATSVESEDSFYEVTASVCADAPIDRCVLLSAVAQTDQANDGDLTLDSRGEKTGHW